MKKTDKYLPKTSKKLFILNFFIFLLLKILFYNIQKCGHILFCLMLKILDLYKWALLDFYNKSL